MLHRSEESDVIDGSERNADEVCEEPLVHDRRSRSQKAEPLVESRFRTGPKPTVEVTVHADDEIATLNEGGGRHCTSHEGVGSSSYQVSDADDRSALVVVELRRIERKPVPEVCRVLDARRREGAVDLVLPEAHSVTSASSRWTSCSKALSSASISARGLGGTYL